MLLSFTQPYFLLLLGLLYYFYRVSQRRYVDLSAGRYRLSLALRGVIIILIVLALAGLQVVKINKNLASVFVVDWSDSISHDRKQAALNFINKATRKMKPEDRAGVVVFGSEAFVETSPVANLKITRVHTSLPTEHSDLSAAVRLALASFPENMEKRVVILSDGNENLGSAVDEAAVARSNRAPVDIVPLESKHGPEALLDNMVLPAELKQGEPFDIKLVIQATVPARGSVKLFRNDRYLGELPVELSKGKSVYVFPQTAEAPGFSTYEARLEAKPDTLAENNRALGFTWIRGKPKVLYIEGDPSQAGYLTRSLTAEKINVVTMGPSGIPVSLNQLQNYDSVILSDVPAFDLSWKQMEMLERNVKDMGCGLVMIGGEESFGPGGYLDTPVERALPVDMEVRNRRVIPSGAVAMIMHSCEFPNGNLWAKMTAKMVVDLLSPQDYVGVLYYGMGEEWLVPMQKLKNKGKVNKLIEGLNAGDMPDFDPTMQMAYQGLQGTKARLRHMIILSDGDPSPPTPALVQKIQQAKITISTVCIGPHSQRDVDTMRWLAQQGRGRDYLVQDPSHIPRIFLKEAALVLKAAIVEEPFTPRIVKDAQIVRGIPQESLQPLLGYDCTSPKSLADIVMVTHQGDPLLATWNCGLGRALAFTSDAKARWAAHWVKWERYAKFWAQAIRWTMRRTSSSNFQTMVDVTHGKGKVTLDAIDAGGNFINFLQTRAKLVTPSLESKPLALEQTAPGRYEATFDAKEVGAYLVNLTYREKGGQWRTQITGAVVPYSPEYKDMEPDEALLQRVAEVSGGGKLRSAEEVFTRKRHGTRSPKDVWLPLLILAALLFPVDVAVRRMMITRLQVSVALQRLAARATFRRRAAAEKPRTETLGRLLDRKARTVAEKEQPPPVEAPPAPPPAAEPERPSAAPPPSPPKPEPVSEQDRMARLREARERARKRR